MSLRENFRENWDDYLGMVLCGLVPPCALLILVSLTEMIVVYAWRDLVNGCGAA